VPSRFVELTEADLFEGTRLNIPANLSWRQSLRQFGGVYPDRGITFGHSAGPVARPLRLKAFIENVSIFMAFTPKALVANVPRKRIEIRMAATATKATPLL
jgi:hypothetical protein